MQKTILGIPGSLARTTVLEAVSSLIINESKTTLRRLIAEGNVQVNGENVRVSSVVEKGDTVTLPAELDVSPPPSGSMEISILREDEHHLVVNKPPGLPVLPDREGQQRDFYDSLMAYVNRDAGVGGPYVRPHLVHRLDKQTSGVLVVAKSTEDSRFLSQQFQDRRVRKTYMALVEGVFPKDEYTADIPLARSEESVLAMVPDRKKGKQSVTEIVVERRFQHFTWLKLMPHTGRQHQLRVHMAALGYPMVVDFLYGRREKLTGAMLNDILNCRVCDPKEDLIDRCPLHARAINYRPPARKGGRECVWAPVPSDMKELTKRLGAVDSVT